MSDADVIIRECVSVADFQQCIELERAVWKDDDIGIMPIRLYMIAQACNAPTIGAFDQAGRLVGFVHTMLALADNHVIYHSHLAAVREGLRHQDIGYRMKLKQREFALAAGIPLIVWTFDPLQSRNAHLNINKLGAITRRYEVNYYGEGLSSVFDAGVPSDRIYAEWWVRSPHVAATLAGARPQIKDAAPAVPIPEDITQVRTHTPDEHLRWRLGVRAEFLRELQLGHIARAFARDPQRGESRYLFGPDDAQFHFDADQGICTNPVTT